MGLRAILPFAQKEVEMSPIPIHKGCQRRVTNFQPVEKFARSWQDRRQVKAFFGRSIDNVRC